MSGIFTGEYMEGEVKLARAEAHQAALRASMLELLMAAGNALHSNFVSGDEAKWKHPSQRESLIELSDACHAVLAQMNGGTVQ
jgi:hypothetical protein